MASKYSIYLSDHSGKNKVLLPVLPKDLPEISRSADMEDFLTAAGKHLTIIGAPQQPKISPEHMVPGKGKNLSFAMSETTGKEVLKILETAMTKQEPVRYTISLKSGGYYVDGLFGVSSFSAYIVKANNWIINFELKGWDKYSGWKAETSAKSKKISLAPSKATIKKGKSKQATLKNVAAGAKITWKSKDTKVAAVSSKGLITGKGKGKTSITATYKKKTYTCEVSVK